MTAGRQRSEESPDSMKQGCRVTPGGGNPRESATEKRLPMTGCLQVVKVKRWGKSPPRDWQQDRHGKPHPEQCQIGASRGAGPAQAGIPPQGRFSPRGPGWQLDRRRQRGGRGMVIQGASPGTESGLQAIRAIPVSGEPLRGTPFPGVPHPAAAWLRRGYFCQREGVCGS